MAKLVEINGYAKVNLSLGIYGKQDSFHNIDSVMVAVDICDKVTMKLRDDDIITVTYIGGESYPEDNAYKAAKACKERYNLSGADIVISKGVPSGIGVGGSAVDAAAVVRGYEKLYGTCFDDNDFLITLGGDVPFLKTLGAAVVKGKGEKVTPVVVKETYIALAYGNKSLGTAQVFALYDKIGGESGTSEQFLSDYKPFNALEKSAACLEPSILESKELLEKAGFQNVVMTGSGAGYIAFEHDKDLFDEKYNLASSLANDNVKLKSLKIVKE